MTRPNRQGKFFRETKTCTCRCIVYSLALASVVYVAFRDTFAMEPDAQSVMGSKSVQPAGNSHKLTAETNKAKEADVVVTQTDFTQEVKNTSSPLDDEILPRLARIKAICGPLCEIDSMEGLQAVMVHNNSSFFPQVRVPVSCSKIMESEDIDAGDTSVPFPLPSSLTDLYSLKGAITLHTRRRYVNVYLGKKASTYMWTEELFASTLSKLENRTLHGTYGAHATNNVRDYLQNTGKINGSRVLVIGSEKPWLEAICLLLGAEEIVTLEYGAIISEHPKVKPLTPLEFRGKYINGTLGLFDTIVSFSSVEHSGLGRYGDALNPWGDLLAVARAWCVTKPGGALALGIPTGKDSVEFNAHRIYGKVRWPLISANWIQVDSHLHKSAELEFNESQQVRQPIMVFEKLVELTSR